MGLSCPCSALDVNRSLDAIETRRTRKLQELAELSNVFARDQPYASEGKVVVVVAVAVVVVVRRRPFLGIQILKEQRSLYETHVRTHAEVVGYSK